MNILADQTKPIKKSSCKHYKINKDVEQHAVGYTKFKSTDTYASFKFFGGVLDGGFSFRHKICDKWILFDESSAMFGSFEIGDRDLIKLVIEHSTQII